ncbi:MAG: hypothetical protein HQK89_17405, partial [Nitrospirae bacterium]|nr:hypothetical protein [Nitrospirota bacterium]
MIKLYFVLSEIEVEDKEDVFVAIKKLSKLLNILNLPRQLYLKILLAFSEITNLAKCDSIRSDSINKIKYVLKKDNDYNYLTIIIESSLAAEGIACNESLHSNQYGMIDIVNVLVDCLSIEHPYPGSVNYSLDVKINNDLDVNQDI